MKTSLITLALLLPTAASAFASTLYKCTDDTGAVLYTNQKPSKRGCQILSQQASAPAASSNNSASAAPARPRASATPTPGDFPRVSGDEQKTRDSDRRAILEKELNNEMQLLEKSRKSVSDAGNQPSEKLTPLRDNVALHERNVEALKKELANLR